MEPPFLVFRDRAPDGTEVVTAVPLDELFRMQRVARQILWGAVSGDPRMRQVVEAVYSYATAAPAAQRGRAVVSAYLLRQALGEYEEAEEQRRIAAQASQVAPAQVQAQAQGSVGGASPASSSQAPRQASRQQASPTKQPPPPNASASLSPSPAEAERIRAIAEAARAKAAAKKSANGEAGSAPEGEAA